MHDIFGVMEKDSVETTHPVSTYVEDPRQVQQYFDEISYEKVAAKNHMIQIVILTNSYFNQKGLAVLRMLRGFIGNEDFKLSIRVSISPYTPLLLSNKSNL